MLGNWAQRPNYALETRAMFESKSFGLRSYAACLACATLMGACSSSTTPTQEGTAPRTQASNVPNAGGTAAPIGGGSSMMGTAMDAGVGKPTGSPPTGNVSGNGGVTNPGNPPVTMPMQPPAAMTRSVTQYHNHLSRDGLYIDATFTRAAAASLKLDTKFAPTVMGSVYAQPLFFDGGDPAKDLVIVATEQNQVSAFRASDGSPAWQKMLEAPATNLPCGNIMPLGVTGTPVIDEASRTLYLDSMTGAQPKHLIYALSLDDGSVKTGWPVDVSAKVQGFKSNVQNQRGGLTILNGMVYVPYGGHYGDCGDYKGWVVGVKLDDPNTVVSWSTRSTGAGIWAPGGIASDGKSLYVATGNGMRDGGGLWTVPGSYGDGESVIRLPADLKFSGQDADFAAAMNWQQLDMADSDVGGSGPMLFSVPGASPSELAIALGKDGQAYVLDAQNLGGAGKFLATTKLSMEQLITAPVAYTTAGGTYVAFKGTGMNCPSGNAGGRKVTAAKIMPGSPPMIAPAWCSGPMGEGSPIVTSTDGMNETIVWYIAADRGDDKLRGFNGETGEMVFAGGGPGDQMGMVNRFQTPILAKGKIYVAGQGKVYAFTL